MALVIVLTIILLLSLFILKYKIATTALFAALIILVPVLSKSFGSSHETSEKKTSQTEGAAETRELAKYLKAFYSREEERTIIFRQPGPTNAPFDIIFLHICSMSWDDLKEIGITQEDPFFKQFDYLFTNFNTATGYSGPAVQRLLQANCGQLSHKNLYRENVPKACLLFEGLSSVGYESYISMNHDGKYGNYTKALERNGLNNAKAIATEGDTARMIFFDGKTRIYNDYFMLKKWLDTRQGSKSERAALYYNSVLLHAGSRWVGEKKWWKRDNHAQFKEVSSVLLRDLKKFIDLLKTSNRNTVLLFVPEHGRALTSSAFQPSDLRDIPLPKITRVPVGVKFIGPKFNNAKSQQNIISKPTSYFALSWLLSTFIENSPFGDTAASSEDIVFKIPKTDFVSEHEGRIIIELDGQYLFYGKDEKWTTLAPDQLK